MVGPQEVNGWTMGPKDFDTAGLQRDLLTFNSTMAVCASAACWLLVVELLEGLQESKLEANAVTMATVVQVKAMAPTSQLASLAALESAGLGTVRQKGAVWAGMLKGWVAVCCFSLFEREC